MATNFDKEIVAAINGKEAAFHVLNNLTEPCSVCGAPACGQETFFWFEEEGVRKTLILDGMTLDVILSEFYSTIFQKVDYPSLPQFIRDAVEFTGWHEADDDIDGYAVDSEDMMEAISLISPESFSSEYLKEDAELFLSELSKMAELAKLCNAQLMVVRF